MNSVNRILDIIKTGDNEELSKTIDDNPSFAQLKTEQGISLLQFAAYCHNRSAFDILRKYKSEIDIFEASSIGDIDTVQKLVNHNTESVNSFSADGFTPLGLASFFGHLNVVLLLLTKGANPNIAANNPFKVTPLHSACATSNYEVADILIQNGADVNAKQMQGVTPLHSAAHNGQTKLAKLLIDRGADINAKMDDGQTSLSMAKEAGFAETADLIRQRSGK